MSALPKRVWLVIILLAVAVISLWLLFLKKELAREHQSAIPLKEMFGFDQLSTNKNLKQTQELLAEQFGHLDKLLEQKLANESQATTSVSSSLATTTTKVK
ncbi:MAG: hypothetical protein NTV81_02970 [Candidatus Komeilibacteria bacterium]|nr:hypothetical protein [Candidatus Komeilibacteria bacterium]